MAQLGPPGMSAFPPLVGSKRISVDAFLGTDWGAWPRGRVSEISAGVAGVQATGSTR
jgi:hypothetical protein